MNRAVAQWLTVCKKSNRMANDQVRRSKVVRKCGRVEVEEDKETDSPASESEKGGGEFKRSNKGRGEEGGICTEDKKHTRRTGNGLGQRPMAVERMMLGLAHLPAIGQSAWPIHKRRTRIGVGAESSPFVDATRKSGVDQGLCVGSRARVGTGTPTADH